MEHHFEHFKALCNLTGEMWGMEEYAQLLQIARGVLQGDALDITNSMGAELLFRRLQTIEYSYSDRLRDKHAKSTTGRLTLEEQTAFGGTVRVEAKLMICPLLLEHARTDLEREAGFAKALVKARDARASLAKKQ